MSRFDLVGMFWADVPTGRSAADRIRVRPPVPETGWKAPTEFPNLSAARVLSFDTETKDPELLVSGPGWGRHKGHIVGFSIGAKDAVGNVGQWYFPMRHEDTPEDNLDPEQCMRWAKAQLETPDIPKVGANLTYDYGWMLEEGIRIMGPLFDVQFAEALLDERARVGLDVLAGKYLNEHKQSSLLYRWCADFYGGNPTDTQRKNIYRSPPSLVGPYGESDASLPLQIMEHQWPLLAKEGLLDLFHMECELIPLMVGMRMLGVPVNISRAEEMYDGFGKEVDILNTKLREMVGFGVNVNSSDDLARAFTAHGLPFKRTAGTERAPDGKPSFTADFLEGVDHPLGQLVVDIRQREKLRSVFIKSYLLDNHVNGIVHGTFNQLRGEGSGTRSGRLSSDTPNLQNIPIRTAIGKKIRSCFEHPYRPWRKYDYCVSPKTRVLTGDLRWVAAGDLNVGDDVIAYDEEPVFEKTTTKPRRYLRTSKVVGTKTLWRDSYRITTDKTTVDCSAEHRWLVRKDKEGASYRWVMTKDLKPNHRICRIVDARDDPDRDFDLGWLSGIYDGEGFVSGAGTQGQGFVAVAQKPGLVLDKIKRLLAGYGFSYSEVPTDSATTIRLTGARSASWKLMSWLRPLRLMPKFLDAIDGRAMQGRCEADVVMSVEAIGPQPVIALETEHKTFIAEGLASHNSQIEYRFLAHYAVDKGDGSADRVRAAYADNPDTDYHVQTQNMVRSIAQLEIARPHIKNMNFGLIYGMGEPKLARQLGVTASKAKEMFAAYHLGAPYAKATMQACISEAELYGTITTFLGRKSRFDLWQPASYGVDGAPTTYSNALMKYGNIKRAYTHKALNRRLQGSAADQMKKAMHQCYKDGIFDATGLPSLTVHDELDFIDHGGRDAAFREMQRVMESCLTLRVPVRADYEIGRNWGTVGDPAEWTGM